MARFLRLQKYIKIILTLTVLTLNLIAYSEPVYAAIYVNKKFTGYAYGNRYGASGAQINQGHFANHSPNYCSGDPAASWAWGSGIGTPAITL